jgi:hypothetical protein
MYRRTFLTQAEFSHPAPAIVAEVFRFYRFDGIQASWISVDSTGFSGWNWS